MEEDALKHGTLKKVDVPLVRVIMETRRRQQMDKASWCNRLGNMPVRTLTQIWICSKLRWFSRLDEGLQQMKRN